MDEDECRAFDIIQDLPDNYNNDPINVNDMFDGVAPINISHTDGEFQAILEDDMWKEGQ